MIIIPLPAQTVTLPLGKWSDGIKGRLLVSGREIEPEIKGDSIRFRIDRIDHYEVLVVEDS